MARRSICGVAVLFAALLGAFAAVAGPRAVTFSYAPVLLAPDEWTQVRAVLYTEFAEEAAKVRAQGNDLLDAERTTVARADIDFDGVEELFVMLYGPDVVCFPATGCLTAVLGRGKDDEPWSFVAAPISILSEGPPRLYLRDEVVGRARTFFSSVDPLIEEPQPDERVKFVRGANALAEADWSTLRDQLAEPFAGRVRERADVDIAQLNAHVPSGTAEWIVTVRNGCATGTRCPVIAFAQVEGRWRPAQLPEVPEVFIGADGLPVLFLRDERKFGWRSGYSTQNGEPRRRVPFVDWGRYGMTTAMLADIGLVERTTGEWLGKRGNAYTGAEFLRDRTLQEMALDRWIDEVADPIGEAAGLWIFEGRVIDYGTEKVNVTHAGITSAVLAEGIAPVLVFFGMLSRTEYKLSEDRYPTTLRASFTVIANRMRDFQNAMPAR